VRQPPKGITRVAARTSSYRLTLFTARLFFDWGLPRLVRRVASCRASASASPKLCGRVANTGSAGTMCCIFLSDSSSDILQHVRSQGLFVVQSRLEFQRPPGLSDCSS
jgi:hypothetical protein